MSARASLFLVAPVVVAWLASTITLALASVRLGLSVASNFGGARPFLPPEFERLLQGDALARFALVCAAAMNMRGRVVPGIEVPPHGLLAVAFNEREAGRQGPLGTRIIGFDPRVNFQVGVVAVGEPTFDLRGASVGLLFDDEMIGGDGLFARRAFDGGLSSVGIHAH